MVLPSCHGGICGPQKKTRWENGGEQTLLPFLYFLDGRDSYTSFTKLGNLRCPTSPNLRQTDQGTGQGSPALSLMNTVLHLEINRDGGLVSKGIRKGKSLPNEMSLN